MPRLKDWGIRQGYLVDIVYGIIRLSGIVYDHHRLEDGKDIITSSLMTLDLKNRKATTKSGSEYILEGDPDPEYIQFLKDKGLWDKYKDEIYPPTLGLN